MAKEVLPSNSYTKAARPPTGKKKSSKGFGRGAFGSAVFDHDSGYEQKKEALPSNSQTKEALPSKIT